VAVHVLSTSDQEHFDAGLDCAPGLMREAPVEAADQDISRDVIEDLYDGVCA